MNNEPVAYVNSMCNDYINWKADPMSIDGQPLYTHPAKELHLSLQKVKDTGELLAVTYTDDEHRIVEVLWQKPPAKTLTDEEIGDFIHRMVLCCQVHPSSADINVLGLKFIVEDILRKAQEK